MLILKRVKQMGIRVKNDQRQHTDSIIKNSSKGSGKDE